MSIKSLSGVTVLLTILLTSLMAVSASAQGTILYSDTFSRTTGAGDGNGATAPGNFSDWGTNDNGLGGTVTQSWSAGPTRDGGGRNAVTNGSLAISHGTSSLFPYDAASASPDGFSVALDFSRFLTAPTPPATPSGYIAFGFGADPATVLNDYSAIGASDFSLVFQQAANGNAANSEVKVDDGTISTFDYLTPHDEHSLVVTAIPRVSGSYGASDTIDINVRVDGTISNDYVITGGDHFGVFSVSANQFDARYIDNLVVRSVPEPSVLALTGLGLLALLEVVRRKR